MSEEIDLNKIMLWDGFKTNFVSYLENNDPFEVDLSFEYRDRSGVFSFPSGQSLFVSDLTIAANGIVHLKIPFGAEFKFVPISYADNISNPSTQKQLDNVLEDCYSEFIQSLEDKKGVPTTFWDFIESLTKDKSIGKLYSVLNNSTEYLAQHRQAMIDAQSFRDIGEFGLF